MESRQHLQKDDIDADGIPKSSAGKTDVQTLTNVNGHVLQEVSPQGTSSPTVSSIHVGPHANAPISGIGLQGVADADGVTSSQASVANTLRESNDEFNCASSPGPAKEGGDPNLEAILPDGGKIDDITAEDDIAAAEVQAGVGSKKKTKKKKPKSKRGLVMPHLSRASYILTQERRAQNNPTGFEEYYVDTPVTPAEYEEEKGMYHR